MEERPEIHVGIQIVSSPAADADRLSAFAGRLGDDVAEELQRATGHRWIFHLTDRVSLRDDEARRPSDFLDEASIQMIEGPFDLVIVSPMSASRRGDRRWSPPLPRRLRAFPSSRHASS